MYETVKYNPANPFCAVETQKYEKFFKAEGDFMTMEGYYQNEDKALIRNKAISLILQLYKPRKKFDAFTPYLAVNYFDRFVSRHEIPSLLQGGTEDNSDLFVMCCLTLASKMRMMQFKNNDFQNNNGLQIDEKLMRDMEIRILTQLQWRMRPLIPLCFVEFFLSYCMKEAKLNLSSNSQKINEIIIQAQGSITFTKFKPSIIAASALLAASFILYPTQIDNLNLLKEKISSLGHVSEKENIYECTEEMEKFCREKNILMEYSGIESGVASSSISGPSKPDKQAAGLLRRRKGKEPMTVIKETPKQEEEQEQETLLMNFQLAWLDPNAEKEFISANLLQPPSPNEDVFPGCFSACHLM